MALGLVLVVAGLMTVLLAIGVVPAVLDARAARRRGEGFAALAQQHGWTYVSRDDQWAARFSGSPFGEGHRRQALNVVVGQFRGRGFASFDHAYYTSESSTGGKGHYRSREVRHDDSVVALNIGVALPPLSVTPEGMISRMIGRLTDRDIEMESEDFNRAFTVACPSRRFASDVMHSRMMELLLTQPNFAFRFDGPSILTVRPGKAEVPEVEARLAVLDAVVGQIPEHVWRTVQGG